MADAPRNGWISSIREAIGMTGRQLAKRMGIAPSNVARMERRETDETITLGALRRAAEALDCQLVYAVVPRRPSVNDGGRGGLLDDLILARARDVAIGEAHRVTRTMVLEDQAISDAKLEAQIAERAMDLAQDPRRLWDILDAVDQPSASDAARRRDVSG